MTPELTATLAPLQAAVERAQHALDAHNRNPSANPLDGLHLAGYVIHAHEALNAAMRGLLEAYDNGVQAECWHETELRLHGRLNTLATSTAAK